MKLSMSLLLGATLCLFSCGKNAHIYTESENLNLRSPLKEEGIKELISAQISSQNLDLGMQTTGASITVPVKINNIGKSRVEKLILNSKTSNLKIGSIDNSSIEIQGNTIAYVQIEVGTSISQKDVLEIQYQTVSGDGSIQVEINTSATSDANLPSALLTTLLDSDKSIVFKEIPTLSSAEKEIKILNQGVSSSIITDIYLSDDTHFSLDKNDCTGSILELCTLKTQYNPLTKGEHKSLVTIEYFTPKGHQTLTIPLTGTAIEKNICLKETYKTYLPKSKDQYTKDDFKIELPYFSKKADSTVTLDTLINTENNKFMSSLESSVYYAQDAQVLAAYELEETQGNIISTEVNINLSKSILHSEAEIHHFTEVICLSNTFSCSGQRFVGTNDYVKLINKNYSIKSNIFSEAIKQSNDKKILADVDLINLKTNFNFKDLFGQEALDKIKQDKSVKLIFADDIKLQDIPTIKVRYQSIINNNESCK